MSLSRIYLFIAADLFNDPRGCSLAETQYNPL